MDNRSIKDNIYKLRRDKGLSQEEVANLMDISLTSYRKIEKGETALISERITQLAMALGITEQELLLGYNPKSSPIIHDYEATKQENLRLVHEINHLQLLLTEKERQIQLLENAITDKDAIIKLLQHLSD